MPNPQFIVQKFTVYFSIKFCTCDYFGTVIEPEVKVADELINVHNV